MFGGGWACLPSAHPLQKGFGFSPRVVAYVVSTHTDSAPQEVDGGLATGLPNAVDLRQFDARLTAVHRDGLLEPQDR